MTREDIQIVEEYTHLKHFVFELVRCIDEGVPVVNFFIHDDESILNAEKYIANALSERQFFGGEANCKFSIGDKVVFKKNPTETFTIADYVNVYVGENKVAKGVAVLGTSSDDTRVYNVSYVNQNFELCDK